MIIKKKGDHGLNAGAVARLREENGSGKSNQFFVCKYEMFRTVPS